MTDTPSPKTEGGRGGVVGYISSYFGGKKTTDTTTQEKTPSTPVLEKEPTDEEGKKRHAQIKAAKEQRRRFEELESRKAELLDIATAIAPKEMGDLKSRRTYSQVLLGDMHTPNPDLAMWGAGALPGFAAYLLAGSFVKNNPIVGLRTFVLVSATTTAAYWGSNTYYEYRKDEIENYRENKVDIEEEKQFIGEALGSKFYDNLINDQRIVSPPKAQQQ
eukprot:gene10790-12573_t